MSSPKRSILVTSALPYANGSIHIGHLVEYIQTDIWVRFQKMRGHQCIYVCADDTHGTPVMLRAEQEGISPEQLIARMQQEHERDFAGFFIEFDNYYSTHSPENQELSAQIFQTLMTAGHISRRTIRHLYDPQKNLFLPDRYIRGNCPRCHAPDQYGDNCEACNSIYHPAELENPVSVLSGAIPVERETEHLFFRLPEFTDMLKAWVHGNRLQPEVANKLDEWFTAGLQEWDISRDPPYFGFPIPGETDKYFYVWLDAPVGYMASLKNLCARQELDFQDYFRPDSPHELYHFIGKDIMYFHCLFWPAILHGAGLRVPDAVFVHGFLTVDGKKMSKTRGTFIRAAIWLKHLPPEYLRYYFAMRLNASTEDIDLNLDDFVQRINSDLVGKVVNIASRCCGFIHKHFAGRLSDTLHDNELHQDFLTTADQVAAAYEARDYARAMRSIMAAADRANQYISRHQPWVLAKQNPSQQTLQEVCSMGLNLFRILCIWLKPVMPALAARAETLFNSPAWTWENLRQPILGQQIQPFEPLLRRVDRKQVDAMLRSSQADLAEAPERKEPETDDASPQDAAMPLVELKDFSRLDIRVARIIDAVAVDGADRLLRLVLDIGEDKPRHILAGVRSAYSPEELRDRMIIALVNLKPRKMRFGISEGMVLAAGPGDKELFLLAPDPGAQAGMRIR